MTTLTTAPVSTLLASLYADAVTADKPYQEKMQALSEEERKAVYLDNRRMYSHMARDAYLPITRTSGACSTC